MIAAHGDWSLPAQGAFQASPESNVRPSQVDRVVEVFVPNHEDQISGRRTAQDATTANTIKPARTKRRLALCGGRSAVINACRNSSTDFGRASGSRSKPRRRMSSTAADRAR